jgi:hypothetical protein
MSKTGHLVNKCRDFMESEDLLPCPSKQSLDLILTRSINNQHYALICTTLLFYILAPTCFGSILPSSGSFLDHSELLGIQTEWVVYLKFFTDKRISVYNVLCRIKQIE